jgi:cell wall-associated NlpC family hydrolase
MTCARDHAVRPLLVSEARSWLGTPYHACAGVKGSGVDCAYLLVRVYQNVGLIGDLPIQPYREGIGMLLRGQKLYRKIIASLCDEADYTTPAPGDVVVFNVKLSHKSDRARATHGALVSDWPRVIHAYQNIKCVIESEYTRIPSCTLDSIWAPRVPHEWTV